MSSASLEARPEQRLGRRACNGECVGRAAEAAGLVPGGGDERVDRARELLGVALDSSKRVAVLLAAAVAAQGQLGLGEHARERRAQLVRELGREALLVPKARGEPVEQRVERGRELGQLVVRPEREAVVEVALAPGGRVAVIRTTGRSDGARSQRAARAGEERARAPPRTSEAMSAVAAVCSYGGERDAGDDGADAAAVDDDRRRVEASVRPGNVGGSARPAGERARGRVSARAARGRSSTRVAREDPDVRVGRPVVGRLAERELSAARPERRASCAAARARARSRASASSCAREHEVEADDEHGDRDARRRDARRAGAAADADAGSSRSR